MKDIRRIEQLTFNSTFLFFVSFEFLDAVKTGLKERRKMLSSFRYIKTSNIALNLSKYFFHHKLQRYW